MKNLIYISGPITDNKTGLPREGWQEDFRAAEEKLRGMGFEVITPIEISEASTMEWESDIKDEKVGADPSAPLTPPRWFYLLGCIDVLGAELRTETLFPLSEDDRLGVLTGLYVIGDMADISMSYGTMCEINFAMAAGLPVWSQYYNGYQMTNMLMQKTDGPTLAEAAEKVEKLKH